jgi:hypothetical protein
MPDISTIMLIIICGPGQRKIINNYQLSSKMQSLGGAIQKKKLVKLLDMMGLNIHWSSQLLSSSLNLSGLTQADFGFWVSSLPKSPRKLFFSKQDSIHQQQAKEANALSLGWLRRQVARVVSHLKHQVAPRRYLKSRVVHFARYFS